MKPVYNAALRLVLLLSLAAFSFQPVTAQTYNQVSRLQQMVRQSSTEWQIRHAEAVVRAEKAGIPIRQILSDGTIIELQKFKNNHPVYFITHNRDAAELSSVNALWPQGDMGISLTWASRTITMWEGGMPRETHLELDGRITFGPTNSGHRHATTSRGTRADEWTHVAAFYHNGVTQIYINGDLDVENISSASAVRASPHQLTLGNNIENNDLWFQGRLDELRIWNRRRSAAEIKGSLNRPLWGDEGWCLSAGAIILGNNRYRLSLVDDGPASRVHFEPMSPGFRHITSLTWLQPGKWYHIAGVYCKGNIWLYINGALDNSATFSAGTISSSSPGLVIGTNHLGSGNYFIGEIDEVRIWKRALMQAEVNTFYNQARTGNEHGLIGYWRFDEPSGDILHGSALRPLNGKLVNGPMFVPSAAMEGDPFAPRLGSPAAGALDLDIPLSFTWHPVDNARNYELMISPGADFRSVLYEQEISDTSRTVSRGLDYDSTYHWRVRAVTNQFPTNWSESRLFTTLLPVPDAPVWKPDHEGEDVEIPVAFSWSTSKFAAFYRVQVSTGPEFTSLVLDTAGLAETVLVVESLVPGTTYYWRVSASNRSGEGEWSAVREFTTVSPTAGVPYGDGPEEFTLLQNYPNPFNPTTQIRYVVAEQVHVRLDVYDALGRRVAALVDGQKSPGRYTVVFDASGLSSGVYLYRLQTDVYVKSRQMVLVR